PFFVRPRLNTDLFKWGWEFLRHANAKHVDHSIPALKELSLLGKRCYQEWDRSMPFHFGYEERGLMMLYKDHHTAEEEKATAELANRIGIEAQVLDRQGVQALEPDVKVDVLGGVYFPGDAHLNPRTLVENLINTLRSAGVRFLERHTITGFSSAAGRITGVQMNDHTGAGIQVDFDELVLAAGSWSGLVGKQLKLSMPMQAGKGYSFTLPDVEKNVRIPSIFLEARVAVTPMGRTLRFGGTMEIVGVDHSINMERVRGIVESIPQYYPEMNVSMPQPNEIWHGLRPCTPDGLPYIGRSSRYSNLVIATGHAMMGLSLAPATGLLVKEIVGEEQTSMQLEAFGPERFE
ncbi:MAG: NAD(P)/FAD-dependent oxidoreductase, partial [Bacteroidota bacterium]